MYLDINKNYGNALYKCIRYIICTKTTYHSSFEKYWVIVYGFLVPGYYLFSIANKL